MAQACGQIGIHMAGIMGDAARRSIQQMYGTDLIKLFYLKSGIDVYSELEVKNSPHSLLLGINSRLREPIKPEILEFMAQAFSEGIIEYFGVDRNKISLSKRFIEQVAPGDIIHICTPNKSHVDYITEFVSKIPHPVCVSTEKPIAGSVGELDRLEYFLRTNGTHGMTLNDIEHYSHYEQVRHFVQNIDRYVALAGKIKSMDLRIEESEGYDISRNRETIRKKVSGGGAGLDMLVHAIAFLRSLGGKLDYDSLNVKAYKCNHPAIQGDEYGETEMYVEGNLLPGERFAKGSHIRMSVGKARPKQDKMFLIEFENGRSEIDIKKKSVSVWNGKLIDAQAFKRDPFYMVFKNLEDCINNGGKPVTNVYDAMNNVRDVFSIYEHCRGIEPVQVQMAA